MGHVTQRHDIQHNDTDVRRIENKGWVLFQSNIARKIQQPWIAILFWPDWSTSNISLPLVLFLECSRKCYDVPLAHKMCECSRMLQDHSCRTKVNCKKCWVLMMRLVFSPRLGNKHCNSAKQFFFFCKRLNRKILIMESMKRTRFIKNQTDLLTWLRLYLDCGVSASHPGMLLKTLQDLLAHV
jgi:hypothetical protein